MAFRHSDSIEVKRIKGKGRGVFARRPIRKGEVIEQVPMLVMPDDENWRGSGPREVLLRVGPGDGGAGAGLRLALQPLVPAQRPLRRRGPADQGVHGAEGYRAGRGDRGQLQRRSPESDRGLVRRHRGRRPERVRQRERLTSWPASTSRGTPSGCPPAASFSCPWVSTTSRCRGRRCEPMAPTRTPGSFLVVRERTRATGRGNDRGEGRRLRGRCQRTLPRVLADRRPIEA